MYRNAATRWGLVQNADHEVRACAALAQVSELEAKEEEELGLLGAGAVAGASGAVATRLRCCLDLLLSLLRCEDHADPEYVLQCAFLLLQKVSSLEVGVGAHCVN